MKLIMSLPTAHFKELRPLIDGCFIHLSSETGEDLTTPCKKGKWLDMQQETVSQVIRLNPEYVILPYYESAWENIEKVSTLSITLRSKGYKGFIIGRWRGEQGHLKTLKRIVNLVSLERHRPRTLYLKDMSSKEFHYEGFRNLDELRRFPPYSLSTLTPITAALFGIDLNKRERRPKNLPEFSHSMILKPETLKLVKKNIQSVKEAAEGE